MNGPMTTAAHFGFHVMAKATGAIGKLDCACGFRQSKKSLYPVHSFRMSDAVLAWHETRVPPGPYFYPR